MDNVPDYGVRFFSTLIVRLLNYYAKHKVAIDDEINPSARDALMVLLDLLPLLARINPDGPMEQAVDMDL